MKFAPAVARLFCLALPGSFLTMFCAILHGILETTTALNTDPLCWLRRLAQRRGGGGGPHFRKANIGRLETETRAENLSGFPLYSSVPLWQQGFRSIPPWGGNSIKGCMLHDAMIEEFSPTSSSDCLSCQGWYSQGSKTRICKF